MKISYSVWFILLTIWTIFGITTDLRSQNHEEANEAELAKNLIVKITSENNISGAGIIFGVRGERCFFIVTAKHVLPSPGRAIEVEFYGYRGISMEAERIYSDSNLDLAILRVEVQDRWDDFPINSIPFNQLCYTYDLNSGHGGYSVGHSSAGNWLDIQIAPPIRQYLIDTIRFNFGCPSGFSGGGLSVRRYCSRH